MILKRIRVLLSSKNKDVNSQIIITTHSSHILNSTSFEEAFILTNYDNAITNELLKELKPNIYRSIVGEESEYEKNKENSYKWQMKLEKCKGEFASKLLYKVVNEELEERIPRLPKYISDGLDWIEKKLGGR